jgi:hypothetical protein
VKPDTLENILELEDPNSMLTERYLNSVAEEVLNFCY